MEQLAFQNMEPKKSRADKIREAKLSFQSSGGLSSLVQTAEKTEDFSGDFPFPEKHYGLYRFFSAVMLFFVLVTAFHFQFSYRGWNQDKIEQVLSDDTNYQKIVKKAETVIKMLEPKGK